MAQKTITYTFQQYPCSYGGTYSVRLLSHGDTLDELTSTSDPVPDFLIAADRDGQLKIYSEERTDKGFYIFQISSVLDNLEILSENSGLFSFPTIDKTNPPADLIYQASFTLTLEMQEPDSQIEASDNLAPFFIPEPKDLFAYFG